MKDLIERLEKATGPDQALDALIFRAIGAPLPKAILNTPISLEWDETHQCYFAEMGGGMRAKYTQPAYTASLDAALTLVPGDCEFEVGSAKLIRAYWAKLVSNRTGEIIGKGAATPAIALCIASLKARAAVERDLTKMEAGK